MTQLEVRPADTTPEPTRLVHRHDFRLFWFGQAASRVGSGITAVAVPLVAVEVLHAGPATMGLLAAAAWLPWLVIGLPAGAWVDRLRHRPVMLGCDLACLAALLAVPLLAWQGLLSIWLLVAVVLVLGAASVFFSTAYQAYLPFLLPPADIAEGNTRLQGTDQVANMAGPPLGGIIAQAFGALTGLVADALSFATSAVCLLRIRAQEPARAPRTDAASLRTEVGQGLRLVIGDSYLRVLALAASADNLLLNGYMALLVLFLVRDVGVPVGAVGLLLTADAVGGLLGAYLARRVARRFGTARAALGTALVMTPFGLLVPLTTSGPGLAFFVVGLLVPAAGMVVGNILVNTFRQQYCPPALLGRMYTSSRFIQYGVMPLGAVLGGFLGSWLGIRPALWVLFAAAAAAKGLRLLGPVRRNRNFPTEYPGADRAL